LVSVVVPGKDAEAFLADALTSLTRQLDDPETVEVIMIDDGSIDRTSAVATSFADRLPRLRVLRNSEPTGLASARNQGLVAATGEYLAFLDADDWLAPGHLGDLVAALQRLDVDFVRTDHVTVSGHRRSLVRPPQGRRGVPLDPRESILPADRPTMVDYPYAWAGMFHRRLFDRGLLTFPEGLHTAEDRPWIWRLHLQAESYAVVDAAGICYRRGVTTSLTQITDSRQLDVLQAFAGIRAVVEADREADRFWPKVVRSTLAVLAHHLGRDHLMSRGDRRTLRAGTRELIAALPPGLVARHLRDSSLGRQARLWPLVERSARRPLRTTPTPRMTA
jgi:glycosyltransferase involved in cell wall biosynthesis